VIKEVDIVVLVKVSMPNEPWTFRMLAHELRMDVAAVHRSVSRLREARLISKGNSVQRMNAVEFLVHAVRYLAPAQLGPSERGVPTAWAVEPLRRRLASDVEPGPVWPDPDGWARGPSIRPLAPKVPELAREDELLHQWLSLVDSLRVRRARERSIAEEELSSRIWEVQKDEF